MAEARAMSGLVLVLAATLLAQERRPSRDSPRDAVPAPAEPVPLLSAEEAIKTFQLPPGFRAEVVATEPMLEHPVALSFDPDGRVFVAEMRSFMPDPHGTGENEPTGRISVLEDTDGDGRMDKSTVFLDGLVLPRGVLATRGGALVAAPPNLIFCRDSDGDGKADIKEVLASDYGDRGNPEHQPNGLLPAIDNWIYNANYSKRLRNEWGRWVFDSIPELGQWGISQDDAGRLYFNTNSNHLRGSLLPPHYTLRNGLLNPTGANVNLAGDEEVWPAHATAVNRGYTRNFLRNGRLARFTAACAPVIYRGGAFPADFAGNAFVCEPSANLVRRSIIAQADDGRLHARNPYDSDEFLTSTYERFRPVNLYSGPDGALWIIDMHHGLIQHRDYLTTYAKKDYLQRQLDKHLHTGRIYRIVHEGAKATVRPQLGKAAPRDLVALLSHTNGWWRDMAQALLVEKNVSWIVPDLQHVITTGSDPRARLHALWTLVGMRRIDLPTLQSAFKDEDPTVRAAAIRGSELLLAGEHRAEVVAALLAMRTDRALPVRLQFALTVSEIGTSESDLAMVQVLHESADSPLLRDAALSGFRGRELEMLALCLSDPRFDEHSTAHARVLAALSSCVVAQASPRRVTQLLELMAGQSGLKQWRGAALLDGVVAPPIRLRAPRRRVVLPVRPAAVDSLEQFSDLEFAHKLSAAMEVIRWPGQSGYVPPPPPRSLSAAEQQRYESGRLVYAATCAQCHKPDGLGQDGLAPPLIDSQWTVGAPDASVRIVLHGMRGPTSVGGRSHNLEMPALRLLSDEQIADALTYVRRSWEHTADPVSPDLVARIRAETADRHDAWTTAELQRLRPETRGDRTR
jgi:mono/diheme cytochrome c family protein/glucose/arabinose dehydrogenase